MQTPQEVGENFPTLLNYRNVVAAVLKYTHKIGKIKDTFQWIVKPLWWGEQNINLSIKFVI